LKIENEREWNADCYDCDDFHDLNFIISNLDNHENLRSPVSIFNFQFSIKD